MATAELWTVVAHLEEAMADLARLRAEGYKLPPFAYLATANKQIQLIIESLPADGQLGPASETIQKELPFFGNSSQGGGFDAYAFKHLT